MSFNELCNQLKKFVFFCFIINLVTFYKLFKHFGRQQVTTTCVFTSGDFVQFSKSSVAVSCYEISHEVAMKFPKDEPRRSKWVESVKRKDWVATSSSVLCSSHFERTQYRRPPGSGRPAILYHSQPHRTGHVCDSTLQYQPPLSVNHRAQKKKREKEKL